MTEPILHIVTPGPAVATSTAQRGRHGYLCGVHPRPPCLRCDLERAAITPKICECVRPGPVDSRLHGNTCLTCGREARPIAQAA